MPGRRDPVGPRVRPSVSCGRDPYSRRPVESAAVGVEWRTVDRLIACAARPCGVAAAVPEAGLMTDQHLARTKPVAAWAVRRRLVIHCPVVVCISSPSTAISLRRCPAVIPREAGPCARRAVHRRAVSTARRSACGPTTAPPGHSEFCTSSWVPLGAARAPTRSFVDGNVNLPRKAFATSTSLWQQPESGANSLHPENRPRIV